MKKAKEVEEAKKVYAIAEVCVVLGNPDDADGLGNEPEPVVCRSVGVFTDEKKAEAKCNEINAMDDHPSDDGEQRFRVVALEVKD